ncbi:ParM/StbA family protein [Hespellia stercorisuis]|nr:ParM/StbA family protein [Hespellia stercorisuis]
MNKKIIIGVDHGYGNMKTAHRVFQTGVEAMEEEPIVSTNFVKYKEKYYVIGESHLVYQGNKTESEDFRILTLAALAEEMKFRGLREANVILAVGLPLAWMKSQGADFRNYLMKEQELHFEFRRERYHVHLCSVDVFPQGFAAIVNVGAMQGMNMLADIGNGTMNVMQIVDNKPLEKSLVTDKFGVGICMKEIQKELSKERGEEIPEMLIEPLLRNGIQGRKDDTARKIARIAGKYAADIMKRLIDYGYKEGLVHLYVIGGGACLLKNYTDLIDKPEVTFISDICANAKGYEYLAEKKPRR